MAIKKEIFNMGMPWEAGYGYSQAVKVGDTIYVSGQVDHDEAGKVLYPGAMERQMRQAYTNVKRVLAHLRMTDGRLRQVRSCRDRPHEGERIAVLVGHMRKVEVHLLRRR
jgi:enamine deaminase RidA (YjgF/YER057c/UK114 family)